MEESLKYPFYLQNTAYTMQTHMQTNMSAYAKSMSPPMNCDNDSGHSSGSDRTPSCSGSGSCSENAIDVESIGSDQNQKNEISSPLSSPFSISNLLKEKTVKTHTPTHPFIHLPDILQTFPVPLQSYDTLLRRHWNPFFIQNPSFVRLS